MLNGFSYLLGVGVFPSQDPVQPRMPPWIYNESLVPGKKKKKKLLCPGFPSGYLASDVESVVVISAVVIIRYAEGILTFSCLFIFLKKYRKLKRIQYLRQPYR